MKQSKCITSKKTILSHPYYNNKTNIISYSVLKNSKNLNENLDIKVLILNAILETKLLQLKDKEQLNSSRTSKFQLNIIEEFQKYLNEELLQRI